MTTRRSAPNPGSYYFRKGILMVKVIGRHTDNWALNLVVSNEAERMTSRETWHHLVGGMATLLELRHISSILEH